MFSQTPLLPEVRTFAALFPKSTRTAPETHSPRPRFLKSGCVIPQDKPGCRSFYGASSRIGTFCIVEDVRKGREFRGSLYAGVSDEGQHVMSEHMIDVDYDTLHFKVMVFSDTEARVIVSYGQIIGGRCLAVIDPATIPFLL